MPCSAVQCALHCQGVTVTVALVTGQYFAPGRTEGRKELGAANHCVCLATDGCNGQPGLDAEASGCLAAQ